nr:PAS domain S-box protein [Bacteroidota bacterium]
MMVFHKMLIFIFLQFVFFNYATGFVFAVSVVCLLILALIIIYLKNIKLKNARDAMYNSELKFRMLAENSMDTLWTSDLELNLEYISPSIRSIFGYEREERLNLSKATLFSQASARKIKNEISKKTEHFKRTGNIGDHVYLELEGIHKDGTKVWMEVTANLTLDADGKLKGFQGISRNITPRKNFENSMLKLVEDLTLNDDILKLKNKELQRVRNEMEQIALKETENSEKLASTIRLMRNVFDAIPGGISVIDKNHNVVELNSKLLEICGIPDRTEAIGKKCYKVFNCGNEPCA